MNGPARPDGTYPVPVPGSRGNYPEQAAHAQAAQAAHAQAHAQHMQAHMQAQAQAAHAQAAHAAQGRGQHPGHPPGPHHQPRMGSWQSPLDYPHRRELINNIIRLFQQRRPNIAKEWQKKLPDFVRRLESALYQSAHSLQEYLDVSTLEQRLQSVARRMMVRSRMPGSHSGSNGNPGVVSGHPQAGARGQVAGGSGATHHPHAQMQAAMYGQRVPSHPGAGPGGMNMADPQLRMPPHHSMPMAMRQQQAQAMNPGVSQAQTSTDAANMSRSRTGDGVDMPPHQQAGMMPMHPGTPYGHPQHHPVPGVPHPQGVPNPQHHMQVHQPGPSSAGPNAMVKPEGPRMPPPGGMNGAGMQSNGPVMSNGAPVLMRNASFPGTPSSSGPMLANSGQQMQRVTINGMAPGQLPGHSAHMHPSSSAGMPQQGMPYHQMAVSRAYHQKPEMGQMMRPPHVMTSAQMAPPTVSMPPSHAAAQPSRQEQHRLYIMKQIRWLLFLRHAHKCNAPEGKCSAGEHCVVARKLWAHIWKCTDPHCKYPRCVASRELLKHHQKCVDPRCPVCGPVREHIDSQRNRQLAAEQYRLCHKSAPSTSQGHKLQPGAPPAMMAPYHASSKAVVMMPPAVPPKREQSFDGGAPSAKRVKTDAKVKAEYQTKKVKEEKSKNSQGTSLLECFTPEQIKSHLANIRKETALLNAKNGAEGSKAVVEPKESCCNACGAGNLLFEPPPLYCLNCNNRIKKGQTYWFGTIDINKHSVCGTCYKDHIKDSLTVEGKVIPKSKLKKKKNEEKLLEPWVQCDYCDAWVHQVCALFNKVRDEGGQGQYACPECLLKKMEKGNIKQITNRPQAMLEAKDLAKTKLSDFLEARVSKFLTHERQVRATALGKKVADCPTAEGLTIRIVNSNDKLFSVLPNFYKHFEKDKVAGEMKYRSKILLLFQKVDGVDLCLFCMYVQEYDKDCPEPNNRRSYLSYLDSVRYFRPENITAFGGDPKTGRGDSLRTLVYQELIMGYLQYLKNRGFTSMYIWACPPLPGDDYIFYVHPQRQKTPKSDRLREWYLRMLKRAKEQGVIEKTSNLWDLYFEGGKDHRVDPCRALDLPYFEGDYIPGAIEEYLSKIHQEREEEKKASGKKSKKTFKGSSSRGKSKRTALTESVDTQVMTRLGDQIKNMKEDFIMVHLQPICSYCRKYIIGSEKRFTCETCGNFDLCQRCYKDDCGLDERSRHPTGSLAVHKFKEVAAPAVGDTSDPDPSTECEIFETRQTFLSLCQGNHYQFDTFRRAKHSSMMVLYHLHNPTAPAFTSSCNVCNREIEPGQGFRCSVCTDFDVCAICKNKPNFSHPHELKKQSSGSNDMLCRRISDEEKRARQEQLRKTMQLLVHASSCQDKQCPHPSCYKVKMLFQHSLQCPTKATGGCQYCRRMWALLQLHAKSCVTPNCPVPRCRDLRQYRRYSQAQAEKRRRMHYHKMMQSQQGQR